MFEFIRTHQRLMQFLLLMVILPGFVFFGIQTSSGIGDDPTAVAKVCGTTIPQQEFVRAQQEQMMQLRQQYGAGFRPEMFDTPESRAAILERLVNQRVLACSAVRRNIVVTDDRLREEIKNTPNLQVDGKFSYDLYKAVAAQRGISTQQLDDLIRQDLVMQVTNTGVATSAFVPQAVQNLVARSQEEQREVQDLVIKSEAYASQVKLTPEAVKAYYDGNQKDFQVPPQVRAEYVVFNMDALIEQAAVSEDEVRQRYEATIAPKFKVKDAARKKIEGILAAVRKDPASFAEQAKANSEDEGSAKSGGDLDFVGPGATVKPFEEVLFKLKENEISGVVESEFGFHIIKLVAIKPGTGGAPEQRKASHILIKAPAEAADFAQAKDALTKTIKAEKAQKLFAEGTDGFADLVYTQPDSLKPAADKYKLKIQSSALFSRANPPKELANPKLLERLFGDDAVKNKRNTEAVELVPGTLVSARVVEYKPQSILPFDDAKANITTMLTRKEALALARKDGEAKLKAAQANADAVTFGAAKTITRGKSDGVEPAALKQVMGASAAKLPVVVGTELPDGYAIYRINKVSQPEKPDPQGREAVKIGLARAQAESDFIAYLAALKVGAKVELRPENLEKKQPN